MAHRLGLVLVKLAAVFLFIQSIQGLAYISPFIDHPAHNFGQLFNILGFSVLFPGVLAGLMWWFPNTVARLGSVEDSSDEAGKEGARRFLFVGVSLLGLYAIIFGLVDGVRIEGAIYAQEAMNETIGNSRVVSNYQTLSGRLAYGAQVIFGLILVFGRKTITRMLLKAKYGGVGAA